MGNLNSNRWIAVIGYIASILSIVQILIFFIMTSMKDPTIKDNIWYLISYQSAIILCIIALCVILVNSQVKNEKLVNESKIFSEERNVVLSEIKEKNQIIQTIAKINHNLNHQLRQTTAELYRNLFFDEENIDLNLESIENKFRGFLQTYTTNIKEAFDVFTGDSTCAVYITLIKVNNNSYIAETFYRDSISYRERTNIDLFYPEYKIEEFTPFKLILDKRKGISSFACDDCLKFENFSDRNENWNKYYNACISVPLRIRESKKDNQHKYIGFLTVDNKIGKLENKDSINLLCSYSDLLYTPFSIFIDLKNSELNKINKK